MRTGADRRRPIHTSCRLAAGGRPGLYQLNLSLRLSAAAGAVPACLLQLTYGGLLFHVRLQDGWLAGWLAGTSAHVQGTVLTSSLHAALLRWISALRQLPQPLPAAVPPSYFNLRSGPIPLKATGEQFTQQQRGSRTETAIFGSLQ